MIHEWFLSDSWELIKLPLFVKDERFNHDVDVMTGYHTRSMLCLPIKDSSNEVIGVAQVINKQGDHEVTFTTNDSRVFAGYLQFCGIGLKNAQLYERSQLEIKRNQVIAPLFRIPHAAPQSFESTVAISQIEQSRTTIVWKKKEERKKEIEKK